MIPLLIWRGHRASTYAQLTINAALGAIIGGILTVAINSTQKANELRNNPAVTKDLVQRINILDGIATYSFFIVAIALIVSVLMISAIVQFNIASARSTIHSLRIYGIPRTRIRFGFVCISLFAAIITFISSFLFAPLISLVHCFVLSKAGLEITEVSIAPSTSVLLWTAVGIGIVSCLVAFYASKSASSLETSIQSINKRKKIPLLVVRIIVFIGVSLGFLAIFRANIRLDNINEIAFGTMFTSLLTAWFLLPILVSAIGRGIKRFGITGLTVGGIISTESRRISALALISSLLLGLGATSALLTLASSSAGKYLAMNSVYADAITSEEVQGHGSSVEVSAFNFDGGWRLEDQPTVQLPVIMFNPTTFASMIDPSTVEAGKLADLDGSHAIADAAKYKLGDTISIVSDTGAHRKVKIVALSKENSIFRGSIGVNVDSFEPSTPQEVTYRSYASSSGGIEQISEQLPEYQWQSIQQFVDEDLKAGQSAQMATIISMIGGIALVALAGLLYSVIGFSIDERKNAVALDRMGVGYRSRLLIFSLIGLSIALASALLSILAVAASFSRISETLESLGVTYPLEVPWGAFLSLWIITTVGSVLGMVIGMKPNFRIRD